MLRCNKCDKEFPAEQLKESESLSLFVLCPKCKEEEEKELSKPVQLELFPFWEKE